LEDHSPSAVNRSDSKENIEENLIT